MGVTSRAITPKQTSVFLLKWAPEHDDLKVEDEVERLQDVFENEYGFKVYNKSITFADGVKAQQQAQSYLSNFVMNEDTERGLLIIYFAGHGYSDAQTSPGDLNITGYLTPATTRDGIIWSQVETTIKRTYSDILLIFDCCNAGRLEQQMRGKVSTYEFLGACQAGERTRGPGRTSFTHALTSVLSDFATKKPFTTEELKGAIKAHEDFPEDQEPVLSFRRLGIEHIVLSSRFLAQQPTSDTLSKVERVKELKNKQYVDFRFWSTDEVQLEHLDSAALVLKPLIAPSGAHWDRIELIKKSSIEGILHKTLGIWKRRAFSGKKRHLSPSAPLQGILDSDMPNSEVANTLTLQIPTGPFASPISEVESASSLGALDYVSVGLPKTYTARPAPGNESIMYHITAIARKLRLLTWMTLTRLLGIVFFRPERDQLVVEEG